MSAVLRFVDAQRPLTVANIGKFTLWNSLTLNFKASNGLEPSRLASKSWHHEKDPKPCYYLEVRNGSSVSTLKSAL